MAAIVRPGALWFKSGYRIRGGPMSSGTSNDSPAAERIAVLETHFEYNRRDSEEIKAELKEFRKLLSDLAQTQTSLATKRDLRTFTIQAVIVCLAVTAGLVGVLAVVALAVLAIIFL